MVAGLAGFETINSSLYPALAAAAPAGPASRLLAGAVEVQGEQLETLGELVSRVEPGTRPDTPPRPEIQRRPACLAAELIEREEQALASYQALQHYFLPESSRLAGLARRLTEQQQLQLQYLERLAEHLPPADPPPGDFTLPPGYCLEPVLQGLTFPTSLAFDDEHNLYVAEAGYSHAPVRAPARIIKLIPHGGYEIIAAGFRGPVTGLAWHDGYLYVAEGGFPGQISRLTEDGERQTLVEGLRSGGDYFTGDIAFDHEGCMYFGVGAATNSGVVGVDNFLMGWLGRFPQFHDVPARDVRLVGANFVSDNPLTRNPDDRAVTGAFHPLGTPSRPGQRVEGELFANAVLYRARADGGALQVLADGLRNVFGLGFDPCGRLLALVQEMDLRGSRPVAGAWDALWRIEPGGWYGWPDFASGLPLTIPRFAFPELPRPGFVLAEHPRLAGQPLVRFAPHSAAAKFAFSPGGPFGCPGAMFVAEFGGTIPNTGVAPGPRGHRVSRVNLATGQVLPFLSITRPHEAGHGPRRPIDVAFDSAGEAMYVLDFGVLESAPGVLLPEVASGALWRVCRGGLVPTGQMRRTAGVSAC